MGGGGVTGPAYRFSWSSLVTADVEAQIARAADLAPGASLSAYRSLLSQVLESAGGLPIVTRVPDAAEQLSMTMAVLHDAVRHTLAVIGRSGRDRGSSRGYVTARSHHVEFTDVARSVDRVPINCATAAAIAAATGLSSTIAERIVESRRMSGPFRAAADIDARVAGVGPQAAARITATVTFDEPADSLWQRAAIANDFQGDLRSLVAMQAGATQEERLGAALEMMAAVCSGDPHPASIARRVRTAPPQVPPPATELSWIGVLAGKEYYEALPEFFAGARQSIDVCIFHIAYASEGHPTRKLLDALGEAHRRNIRVRVLMDRDRATDPYKSTIVNTGAKRALTEAGIPVRLDKAERLLHSKFLVIDGERSIVGSHNWSAGSYFDFDDLTVVISSKDLAAQLGQRFETLWSVAEA